MPLIPFHRTLIDVPVSDRRNGDSVIRQKARFVALLHEQLPDGEARAVITVMVDLYGADADGFGPPLSGQGFSSYRADLVADNKTLVNPATGEIIGMYSTTEQARQAADELTEDVLLQGDFFLLLRETQDIRIGDMIRHHIQQADAMGRFA